MKLNELLGVKQLKGLTRSQVGDFAEKSGQWKLLGKGAFAYAYEHNGAVYKFWLQDSSYEGYVDYCNQNPNNPYLPKFLSPVKRIPAHFLNKFKDDESDSIGIDSTPDKIVYVKMEKLSRYDPDNSPKIRIFKENPMTMEIADLFYMIERVSVSGFNARLCRHLENPQDSNGDYLKINHPDILNFIDTFEELRTLCHKINADFDLHAGNIAMRGDQLVIIDPFYNYDELRNNRHWAKFEKEVLE